MGKRRSRHRGGRPKLHRYLKHRRTVRVWVSVAACLILMALMLADRQQWLIDRGGDDLARYDGQTFVVDRVVDGDTLILRVWDGDSSTTRVRLWGIDSPELAAPGRGRPVADPWAEAARDRVQALVEGRRVYLELEPSRVRGRHGRVLAFVRMPDGEWLNERLLVEGLAAADNRWPHRHVDRYRQLEHQAKRSGAGIWQR